MNENNKEREYAQMLSLISAYVVEFLPEESELTVLDGVKILYYKYQILNAEKQIDNILSKD